MLVKSILFYGGSVIFNVSVDPFFAGKYSSCGVWVGVSVFGIDLMANALTTQPQQS